MTVSSIFKRPRYDWVVWESDLSKLITETYGREYRLQQVWEADNGSFHPMDVSATDSDGQWETYAREEMDLWLDGRSECVDTEVLFWDMCRKGVVPAGQWLVEVWW